MHCPVGPVGECHTAALTPVETSPAADEVTRGRPWEISVYFYTQPSSSPPDVHPEKNAMSTQKIVPRCSHQLSS